jgi:hypothetical protein
MLGVCLQMWGELFRRADGLSSKALKEQLEHLITENFEAAVNKVGNC